MAEDDGTNNADKRARVYGRATGREGTIEVTVRGSEGETTEDVMEHLPPAVSRMEEAHDRLQEDEERREVQ